MLYKPLVNKNGQLHYFKFVYDQDKSKKASFQCMLGSWADFCIIVGISEVLQYIVFVDLYKT